MCDLSKIPKMSNKYLATVSLLHGHDFLSHPLYSIYGADWGVPKDAEFYVDLKNIYFTLLTKCT
jgi:hypothetical protein